MTALRVVRAAGIVALALVGVVLALAALLVVNAWRTGSRQIAVAPIAAAAVDEDAAARRLAEAIRFRTVSAMLDPEQSGDALRALHAHLQASFPAFHAAASREIVGGYSLLYTWQGADAAQKPVALLAHQDVVPIAPKTEGDWTHPPFDGVTADGFVWGRGSWDDKGNLYAMMEAAEALAKQGFRPKRTIYFAFGHDEEVSGLRGARAIAALLQSRGVRLDFVLDEGLLITEGIMKGLDRPAALVGLSEKGYATLFLTARATPGHSSMPPRDTAIGMMSAALSALESNRFPLEMRATVHEMFETLAPEMGGVNRVVLSNLWLLKPLLMRELAKSPVIDANLRTTTALTIVNAGDKDNVLPGVAEAAVNFRLLPGDTQQSVIDRTRRVVANDRIAIAPGPGNTEPPPVTPASHPAYQAIARTIREVFPDVVVAPGLMVAATDSRHYADITDAILRFSPVRANTDDLKRFHGTNERLGVKNYADMIRFYRRLLETN